MSYTVPTIDELIAQALARHRAELPGTDASLWPNTEHVFVKTMAGLIKLNYDYLAWIKRQRFASEADGDELEAIGRPYAITRRPAAQAHGNVFVTGTPGTTIIVGTTFSRSDGELFSVTDEVVIDGDGTSTVAVRAVVPGASGNTDAGAPLTQIGSALAITGVVVDTIGIGAGADVEDDEALRARILFRQRNEPMGGSPSDYVRWASSIPGVTRVWVEPRSRGHGTVGVWFMADGSTADGIPGGALVDDVADYLATMAPTDTEGRLFVAAPTAAQMDVRISGLNPSTTIAAQIEAEVRDVFRRQVSVSMASRPFTFRSALIWQAVSRVTGDVGHQVTLPVDVELLPGYIPTLGSICYIT